jgi:acyl-homoserine-lactone acylase
MIKKYMLPQNPYKFSCTVITSVIILAFVFSACDVVNKDRNTEILWDNYGVPHIYGRNTREMYYSFGWAQMHNHGDLLMKLYGQARGRASEYWGVDFIESDKKILLFKIPEKAEKVYKQQDSELKLCLDAFVKGINDYADSHPEELDENMKQVLPVTTYDVIAHTLRVIYLEFLGAQDIYLAGASAQAGSNAVAIGPLKSASGNAMLVINPHLPWSDFYTWFEAHLNTGDYNAYGIALVGTPSLAMGFNNYLGWALTINPIDASDRYELVLKEDGYFLDGKIIPFEKKKVTIKVKQKDGNIIEQENEFRYSEHGPVVARNGEKAYAVRIAGMENAGIFEQYFRMSKAKNFREFEGALKMMQIPMFNIIYADKEGNIFYLFNGNVPVRNDGDFSFWNGTIDGSKSKYIWDKIHSYKDLPKLLNPPTGFVQNCNESPWSCTYPFILNPGDYPSYMSSGILLFFRQQRSIIMLKDNMSVTYDKLIDYKQNTEMETANRFLDDLLSEVENNPDSLVSEAGRVLRQWDRKTETTSRGAILFAAWWDKMNNSMFKKPWNSNEPLSTPDGLKDEKQAVNLLKEASKEIIEKYGALDIAWGEIYRFKMNGIDYPGNGGPGDHYGLFRAIYYTDIPGNRKAAVAGDTFIAVIEFGEKIKAMVSLSYGNATQEGSRHRGDQLKDLSDKVLRQALLEKEDVMKHLEKKETLKSHFMMD